MKIAALNFTCVKVVSMNKQMLFKSQSLMGRKIGLMVLMPLFMFVGCSSNAAKHEPDLDDPEAVLKAVDKVASEKRCNCGVQGEKNANPVLSDISPQVKQPDKNKQLVAKETKDIALPTFKDMQSKKQPALPLPVPESPPEPANDKEKQKQAKIARSDAEDIPLPSITLVKASGYYPTERLQVKYAPVEMPASNQAIWQTISTGYQLSPHSHRPDVQQAIQLLTQAPQALKATSRKASRYLPYILQAIHEQGLPTEIALLPFVESGFSLTAHSHANAAGLWQFIPETGQRYGLIQTAHYDQRLNLHHSTQAALKYLRDLHQRFDGDWLLALAAYNAGEGRVEREIQKNQHLGKATDYWSLDLPKETREYVPRILAYRGIIGQMAGRGI